MFLLLLTWFIEFYNSSVHLGMTVVSGDVRKLEIKFNFITSCKPTTMMSG